MGDEEFWLEQAAYPWLDDLSDERLYECEPCLEDYEDEESEDEDFV